MKSVALFFIRRPVTSLMAVSVFLILGVISIPRLPVGLMPNLASPGITIITRYPGVSADKIEELLTIPVERVVSDVPGIEKMLSVSSEGESRVNLIFSHDNEIKIKILETSEKVRLIRDSFPREVQEPYIVQYDPTDRPVFIASFSSDTRSLKELREYVDKRIKLKFERIEGVSQIFAGGGFEREIQVFVDPEKLATQGVSPPSVMNAISSSNIFRPGGKLGGRSEAYIYTDAKFRSIDEIGEIRIPVTDPSTKSIKLIRLSDVAEVKDHYRERENISRTDGEDRVSLYIQKAGNANTIAITDECREILKTIPEGPDLRYHVDYNQGKYIRQAIQRVVSASYQGGLIAVLVLYLFLRNLPSTLMVALTIPSSILTTFFLMFLSGIEINVMSLSGLALGTGMLIDNSIVVSESIESHLALHSGSLREGVIAGTREVTSEILSSTLTTIVVFIPLIFTDPETRMLYQDLSVTVVFSLLVSLFFSLTVLPSFIHTLLRRKEAKKSEGGEEPLSRNPAAGFASGLAEKIRRRFASAPGGDGEHQKSDSESSPSGGALHRALRGGIAKSGPLRKKLGSLSLKRINALYRILNRKVMRRPIRTLLFTGLLIATAVPSFLMIKKENSNPLGSDMIEATVDLDTGIHLDRTEKIVRKIEKALSRHPAVKELSSRIEKWHATLHIKVDREKYGLKNQEEIIDELKKVTDPFEEAFVYYTGSSEGESGSELNIDFYGDDIPLLKKTARELSGKIHNEVKGVKQAILRFRDSKNDILILPDRTKTAGVESTVAEMGSVVRNLVSGAVVSKFYDRDREVDIRFKGRTESVDTPEKIRSLMIPLEGRSVPLNSVALFRHGEGETKIWRKNKRKSVSITLRLSDRSMDLVAADVEELIKKNPLPGEMVYAFGDEYVKLRKNQKQMIFAIVLAIVVIYLLLGILFESFSQPLLILLTVPLTLIATLDLLALLGLSLNISVYIGFIMLSGIIVNNSIILVSTINQRLKAEKGVRRRRLAPNLIRPILSAAASRIRPILMTTITTVFGMLPMVFDFSDGSALWRNLAITTGAGLTLSLFLNMALMPFASYLFASLTLPGKLPSGKAREEPLTKPGEP